MSNPPPTMDRTPRLFRESGRTKPLAIHVDAMSVTYEPRKLEAVCTIVNGVATICIEGPLDHKFNWFFEFYENILAQFRTAIESDEVSAVILKIDSPGGDAAGLNETVNAMRKLKAKWNKPVYAYVDESAYSAAYALACVADEIYLPQAGGVGSIGVISCLVDRTQANLKAGIAIQVITSGSHKADGNPNVPFSDGAVTALQERVDYLAGLFFNLVADARGMSASNVQKLNAECFDGPDAVRAGLADGVMSFSDLLAAVGTSLALPRKQDMGLISLTHNLNTAREAFEAAKPEDKPKARAALALAEAALSKKMSEDADAESKASDEEESDEDEKSDAGTDSDADGSESASAEDDEDDSSEDGSDSDSDDEDDKDKATTGLHTKERLLRMCRKGTGKSSIGEVMGALDAMFQAHEQNKKLSARVKQLEATHRSTRIEQLIKEGKASKKITPGNEKKLRAKAEKHGAEWLASFLEMTTPVVGEELTPAATVGSVRISEKNLAIYKSLGMNQAQMEAAERKPLTPKESQ